MRGNRGRLAHGRDEVARQMVDLQGRKAKANESWGGPGRPHETREVERRLAVSIAAQVDSGEHDLAVTLTDPPANLCEDGGGRAAPRRTSHLGDDTEVAREAAAVLDFDEGTYPIEPDIR